MKEIKTNVYTFDELSPEAKQKARDWYKNGDDMPFLQAYMEEQLKDKLEQYHLKGENIKIFYSLSYCQGDGAMFEGIVRQGRYTAHIKHSGHYYHFNSKEIDMEVTVTGAGVSLQAQQKFNDLYVKICRELAKDGYNYIEEERSDESVDNNILANEYTFTAKGERFG